MARRNVAQTQEDANERDYSLVRDRNAFLAALDRNAPQVLRSLEYRPIHKHDVDATDLYVCRWLVTQWRPLAGMPWFRDAARVQAGMEDRETWRPLGPYDLLSQSAFDPAFPHARRTIDWHPGHESAQRYKARVLARAEEHVAEVKRWMQWKGHPAEPPGQRERDDGIRISKRWDLVVRRIVLGETYEVLRKRFGGELDDKVLRMTIRRYAMRIRLPVPKRT